jgi:chemotaxis protein CheX
MSVAQPITEALVRESIVKAVRNVCQTMMRHEATARPASEALESPGGYQLMGNVGFAGEANGVVYLCLSDDFASFATGEILGMTPEEIKSHGYEVIKDAIGEITNMTAGGFKNQLCDVGFPCKLTLPTIVRGTGLSVAALKGTARYICVFDCAGHQLTADIQLKIE